MSTTNTTLPDELLFEADGHLTETALTCIADGELQLVAARAVAHLDGCDGCSTRLGEAALLSIGAGEALGSRARVAPALVGARAPASATAPQSAPKARRPVPVAAIAAALFLAAVTASPALIETQGGVASALRAVPFLVRVGAAFLRAPWGQGAVALFVKCASALVLVAVGLQVARTRSRSGSWQQGGV